jgi:hypothetical protein
MQRLIILRIRSGLLLSASGVLAFHKRLYRADRFFQVQRGRALLFLAWDPCLRRENIGRAYPGDGFLEEENIGPSGSLG